MSYVQSAPGAIPIIVDATFPVPPSKVFDAWTDPEQIKKWFGLHPGSVKEASIDLTPGGHWRFVEANGDDGRIGFEGSYLEISPNQRLVFSWAKFNEDTHGHKTSTPKSRVEITFDKTDDGTEMHIVHSNVDPANGGFAIGWNGGITNLATHLMPTV